MVRVAALFHLSSSWGGRRHGEGGEVRVTGSEPYWLNRQATARALLENMSEVERRVVGAS